MHLLGTEKLLRCIMNQPLDREKINQAKKFRLHVQKVNMEVNLLQFMTFMQILSN